MRYREATFGQTQKTTPSDNGDSEELKVGRSVYLLKVSSSPVPMCLYAIETFFTSFGSAGRTAGSKNIPNSLTRASGNLGIADDFCTGSNRYELL